MPKIFYHSAREAEFLFFMSPKLHIILIRLFFIVIFISATSVAYLLLPNEPTPHPRPPLFENGGENSATTTPTVILKPKAEESLKKNTEYFQTTTFSVNDQNYTLQFNAGENLLTAMRRLDNADDNFQFSGREYPSLGFFVEEINGIKNNPTNNEYWGYYINGKTATVGISLYILKLNDLIKWQYVANKF